eukprot:s2303_g4.t2
MPSGACSFVGAWQPPPPRSAAEEHLLGQGPVSCLVGLVWLPDDRWRCGVSTLLSHTRLGGVAAAALAGLCLWFLDPLSCVGACGRHAEIWRCIAEHPVRCTRCDKNQLGPTIKPGKQVVASRRGEWLCLLNYWGTNVTVKDSSGQDLFEVVPGSRVAWAPVRRFLGGANNSALVRRALTLEAVYKTELAAWAAGDLAAGRPKISYSASAGADKFERRAAAGGLKKEWPRVVRARRTKHRVNTLIAKAKVHRRLLRRLQRQGGVAGASDTDEVQLDLGFLSGSGNSSSVLRQEQAASLSCEAGRSQGSKVEVATMTEDVPEPPEPEAVNCPGPGNCGCREGWLSDDPERPEIIAFLASLAGGEAKRPRRRRWQPIRSSGQGRLDDLLAAAEAATPKSCLSGMPMDPQPVTPRIEEAATLPSSPAPPQNTKEEAEFLEALQAEMPSRTVQEEHAEERICENFAEMKRAVALPTSPGCDDPSHTNSPELEPPEHWPRPWLSHANVTVSTANGVSFSVTSAVEDVRLQADEVYYERASPSQPTPAKVDLLQRLADWQSTKPGNEVGKKADAAVSALPCGPIGPSAARLRRCTACDSSPHSSTRNLASSPSKDKDSNGEQQKGRQAGIRLTARARPTSCERPIAKTARTPRSVSLPEKMRRLARSAPENQASPEQRHPQQKQATTKCRPTAASGYMRPPLSSRPEFPARQHNVHRRHAKASEECSTHAASSCSSSEPVEGQSKTRARPQPPEHQYQVQPGKVFKLAGAMAETSQANEATDGPALDGYMQQHQIQPFEMLTELFAALPEDPYEYMTYHLASRRPDQKLVSSGVLWALLPGGDPMSLEQWRLRRCWLTEKGTLCVSNSAADVVRDDAGGVVVSPPKDPAPQDYPLEKGATHRELDEAEASRPFAFQVAVKPGPLAHRADKEHHTGYRNKMAAAGLQRAVLRNDAAQALHGAADGGLASLDVVVKRLRQAVIRLSSADCSRVTSAASSPRRCISVEVRAKDCVWAYRGVRRQVEAPHLYFGHVPRSTFESHGCSKSTRSFGD